jgi:signal transduction histidine kinase/ligand-binding sensor domain-containing protein
MSRSRSRVIVLSVVAALALATRAQALDPARTLTQYVHRIWQTQQGLPQPSVYAVVQTADGRLWLGTQTGLVRFDGVRFIPVREADGVALPDLWVTQLHEDRDHALWIGTDSSGVFRLLNGALTRFSIRDGLPSDSVQCLFEDHDGRLWVCTARGLAHWNGRSFDAFAAPSAPAGAGVPAACETSDRRLWIAHDGKTIDVWSGGREEQRQLAMSPSGMIRSMLCAASGDVWVGTSEGVFRLSAQGDDHLTTADGLADNSVLTMAFARDGAVLVGTNDGFSRVRGHDVESFRSQDGLSQSSVYGLHEDREGTLWVATGHGLNQFLDGRTTPYTTSEGLPSNHTGPVVQDRAGVIWTGTLGAGLSRFDGHRFSTFTTRDGLMSDDVLALATDGSRLWVGTDRGLNLVHAGRVESMARGLPASRVQALVVDPSGTLWVGTSRGLAAWRNGAFAPLAGSRGSITALGLGRDGALYIGSADAGLQVYADGVLRTVADDQPALRHVDAIYTDAQGVVWIGTAGDGLLAIDRGQLSRYTVRDGLFDDTIYAILGDGFGRLWMACSRGIFSVERAQVLRFHTDAARKLTSTPYSPTDALRTIECQRGVQPAAWAAANGQLWFSTTRGLLMLDSKNTDRRFEAPPAAIEDVTVNGERRDNLADIGALPPGRNNVAFRYTGLSYVVPTRIVFKYMLEGFDTRWVDAGTRREAFYTNLPPGRYSFRVAACNLDGDCRNAARTADFVVEAHYYQRSSFVLLCIAGLVLAGITAYHLRIRRLRAQFDLVLAERSRIARELHDTLLQGFSGIAMAMQALAARLPGADDRRALEQIVSDAGSSLREARRSLTGLRTRPQGESDLADAIARTSRQLTEARNIRLRLKLGAWDRALAPEVEDNLLRIAQEAVLNAVKHSGARSLLVALERTANRVQLLVKDDGAGFDSEVSPAPGHFGVVGMRERAAHIGATLSLESAPGAGTAVQVIFND